ncbi:EamA-like transporter family protein [Pseudoduganella flava]|uniref:EamA family transporter n=1 Tax=Pseudoduganella flava TaxID=871742 RepID=A0A562PSH0_9BURK|nr:DMT family transporter [Pseudoduganella flava]QGZ39364.1 EamA family transporter [Pseudoduganella flava]TWI47323.1 EamA-like transporter family protein [Pseudoduganella flava]
MSRTTLGYLYLALSMITVGSAVVASKIVAASLPPFTATALRYALALPCFLLLMRWRGVSWPALPRRDWLLLVLQAGAGAIGYTALLMAGLRLASAGDAAIIVGMLPLVAALFAVLALGERPGAKLWLALTAAAAGVALATVEGGADAGSWLGNALVLGAVVCESLFILLNRKMTTPVSPLALSVLMTVIGFALSAVAALFEAPWQLAYERRAMQAVAYYALVPTVAGYLLWYAGAQRVPASEASLMTAVAPVAALALAALVLGEPVTASQVAGAACVLGAVLAFGLAGRRLNARSSSRTAA